ncbi:uncharacterized protein isoform X2 [Rhodnius prolixus]|uniref:uncharacterized protein isoform X2 n=1 Tax=Rhodnius prolixus TaxID=13249 RepID=UPI003D18F681
MWGTEQIQFLDLDDVDSQEIEYLQSVLYSLRSTHLELPWVDDVEEIQWDQHHYDGNGSELNVVGGGEDNGGSGGGGGTVVVTEVYEDPTQQAQQIPQQVPQQVAVTMQQVPSATTTIHQMYHPAAVVPQMPNLAYVHQQNMGFGIPPPAAFHAPPPPPPQQGLPYDDRGRRPRSSKPSPKRGPREAYPPPPHQYPPQYPPLHLQPYQYISSAQHATGPPLYLAPPPPSIPMYPTLYGSYTPVFSPHMQQPQPHDEMKEPPPQHQPPPQVYPVEKQEYLEEEMPEEPPQQPPSHTPPQQPLLQAPPPQLQQPQPQPQPPPPMQPQPAAMPSPPLPPPPNIVPQPIQPLPPTSPPQIAQIPLEKPPVKSLPINAIKTTAPPSLAAKRRPQLGEEPPPPMAPQPQPGKSWAALFKGEEPSTPSTASPLQAQNVAGMATTPATPVVVAATPSPNQQPPLSSSPASTVTSTGPAQRAPPINAVVVTAPPHMKTTLPQPSVTTKPAQHDPQLKKLGDVLSTYQLEHRAIVLTPRGLTNPSNYCYINATLQALLACPAFYNLISTISNVKQHTPSNNQNTKLKTPVIDSMVQFIKEFSPAQPSRMMRREKAQARRDKDENSLDMHTGVPFEPNYVYKMLHALRSEDSSFTEEGRQEDAEEFLSLLLNGLNDEMLELLKLIEEPTPVVNGDVTSNGDTHPEDNSDWKEVTNRGMRITRRAELERTPLSDIFRGQLRSSLCRENEEVSDNIQPFFTLQLDIESSDSVPEALEKLVGKDVVEGTSRSEVNTWQTHTLDLLPCVLILHLKCFHYKQQTCSKIVKALQYPIDLRLDPKLLSNKNKSGLKSRQYKLFAVVYHDGKEATKGHYLSDVFHVGTSGWIRYDDAVVRSVPESQVLNPPFPRVPYLLYYRRQDTIGQQGVQQQQQQHHPNSQQSMAAQLTSANNQHHSR